MRIKESLYGFKQDPLHFSERNWAGLLVGGFSHSAFDPCLFMKDDEICVLSVDDKIFTGTRRH